MRQVKRYLKDKAFDHIDHALGRPVDPLGETYREYFATDDSSSEAAQFRASEHWKEGPRQSDMVWFYVTRSGREALAAHLKQIGDKNRLFTVSWGGYDMTEVATTRSKARYSKWLDLSDALPDLTFKEFQATARVRLA